ncbi:MAG: phosphoglycerate kinase [Candidatus Micrarchaeota archaeon]
MDFLTLDDVEVRGKRVLVRVDINCPVDKNTGTISAGERIEGHSKTIGELAENGAKVVILAHQGRKGEYDYISLEQHAGMLSTYIGRKVRYVPDLFGEKARGAIDALKDGEILLLENTRFFEGETEEKSPEEHANGELVSSLAPLADYFVLDAFSAAHRSHASIVGFANVMKSVAGRVMEWEVKSIAKAIESPKKPCVFIVGGAKPEDSLKIMDVWLEKGTMDQALVGGVMGNIMLIGKGYDIGKPSYEFLKRKNYLELVPKAKELLERYGEKIVIPTDVAVDSGGNREELGVDALPSKFLVKDIGENTATAYAAAIMTAGTVIINGPMGVSEEKEFEHGTRLVLEAIANSSAFSLAGGGHTIAAIDRLGIKRDKIGYISLAGKALMKSLLGKKLVGG